MERPRPRAGRPAPPRGRRRDDAEHRLGRRPAGRQPQQGRRQRGWCAPRRPAAPSAAGQRPRHHRGADRRAGQQIVALGRQAGPAPEQGARGLPRPGRVALGQRRPQQRQSTAARGGAGDLEARRVRQDARSGARRADARPDPRPGRPRRSRELPDRDRAARDPLTSMPSPRPCLASMRRRGQAHRVRHQPGTPRAVIAEDEAPAARRAARRARRPAGGRARPREAGARPAREGGAISCASPLTPEARQARPSGASAPRGSAGRPARTACPRRRRRRGAGRGRPGRGWTGSSRPRRAPSRRAYASGGEAGLGRDHRGLLPGAAGRADLAEGVGQRGLALTARRRARRRRRGGGHADRTEQATLRARNSP